MNYRYDIFRLTPFSIKFTICILTSDIIFFEKFQGHGIVTPLPPFQTHQIWATSKFKHENFVKKKKH